MQRLTLALMLFSIGVGSACLSPSATTCGELLCPTGLVCSPEGSRCVRPAEVSACAGASAGDDCAHEGGPAECVAGVCTLMTCGDGLKMKLEACDDGNRQACDGCAPDCRLEGCGNGVVECNEQCDDGASNSSAPNAACRVDCRRQRCGDGIVDERSGEDCDGAPPSAESCTSLGFYSGVLRCSSACRPDLSSCQGSCGDGVVNGGEFCDGLPPSGQTCQDFGYAIGNVYCGQLCTPNFATCERLGFVPMPYQGDAFFLNAAWSPGDQVFAAGYDGLVLVWDGARWVKRATGLTQTLYGLGGSGPNDVYAGGQLGALAHFDGTTWAAQDAGIDEQINAIWASSARDVFVGARGGVILHSRGDGAWASQTNPFTGRVLALWGFGPNDVFASGVGEIAHFDGTSWTAMTVPQSLVDDERYLYAMWGAAPNDVWAVGEAGVMVHYDGQAWSLVPSGTTEFLNTITGRSATDVWVAGAAGTVLHFDGTRWAPVPSNTTQELTGIVALSDRVIAVAPGTLIEHRRGTPFVSDRSIADSTENVFAVWAVDRSNVFASVGTTVYRFDGSTWTDLVAPTDDSVLWSLWAPSADALFAVGESGLILRFDGTTWTRLSTSITDDFNWVWGTSATDVYAAGNNGALAHFDGTTWSTVPTNVSGWLYGVWGSGPRDVFAVGEDSAVLHWNGAAWESLTVGTAGEFWGVWGAGSTDVYLMNDSRGVVHYDGSRFSKLTTRSRRSFNYASGTSPSNAYALEYRGQGLFHFDGVDWADFTLPAMTTLNLHTTRAGTWVSGTAGKLLFVDQDCASRETSCSDRWDNDCDGLSNCADPDCAQSPSCSSGGLCQTLRVLSCNTSNAGNTVAGTPRLERYACASRLENGREVTWRFEAPSSGRVTVALSSPLADLDAIVLGASAQGACDPRSSCLAATPAVSSAARTATFDAVAGRSYWVVVDGAESAAGPFELRVECP